MSELREDILFTNMFFEREIDRITCSHLERGMLLEDVINTRASTNRVFAIPELAERLVAIEAIWDRGRQPEDHAHNPPVPTGAVIAEYISPILQDESELWEYAS